VEISVGKNRTETVGINEKILIKADRTEDVKGKETVTVVGDRAVTILSNDKLDVTQKIEVTSGDEIEITAKKKITLTVGKSSITIDETSIKIATVLLDLKGSATAKLSSALTNVEAQGILTAKGGVVMIN
jgi:type VI secretion system secreted protein VgrG